MGPMSRDSLPDKEPRPASHSARYHGIGHDPAAEAPSSSLAINRPQSSSTDQHHLAPKSPQITSTVPYTNPSRPRKETGTHLIVIFGRKRSWPRVIYVYNLQGCKAHVSVRRQMPISGEAQATYWVPKSGFKLHIQEARTKMSLSRIAVCLSAVSIRCQVGELKHRGDMDDTHLFAFPAPPPQLNLCPNTTLLLQCTLRVLAWD